MYDLENYDLPESDDKLLDECDVSTFKSTGPGGQGVNTTDSAVRLRHRPTGIVVTCRRERSQYLNRRMCLDRLRRRITEAQHHPPERKPTSRPEWADELRLEEKHRTAAQKRLRRNVPTED